MPRTRRTRSIKAQPEALWELLCDPRQLPRWWPRVERVEQVERDGFTEVLRSSRGRAVRADFHVAALERPRLIRWVQQLEGTPFEGLLQQSQLEISLAPDAASGTLVTLELDQALVGASRLGAPFMRRATGRRLDQALDALAGLEI